jgi:hypothetical protein
MNLALEIGQGLFAVFALGLDFEQEDSQGAKQAEIACGGGIAHGAAILILSAVAAVVLAIFNTPMAAGQLQQALRWGLLRQEGGDAKDHLVGFLEDLAFAEVLEVPMDANELGYSGQANGLGVGRPAPELTIFNPTVVLVQRLGLRGENCPAATAGLWLGPKAGWLLKRARDRLRCFG